MAGPVSRWERAALVFIVLLILLLGVRAVFGPEERLAFLFYDDAYYYLGVARHLASGDGSTFDGINPTNGYHPLWCWLLVPIFLVSHEPGTGLRLAATLWFTLSAAAPLALWWALRPRTGSGGAVAAAGLFGLNAHAGLGLERPNGLETPLYALLIALFIGGFERLGARESSRAGGAMFRLGLLLGLVLLARLDGGMLAVAAVLLLFALRSRTTVAALATVVWLAAGASLVAGPSLLWSVLRFGSPMPVSGRAVSLHAARQRHELGGPFSAPFLRQRAGMTFERIPLRLARSAVEPSAAARVIGRSGRVGAATIVLLVGALTGLAIHRRRRHGPVAFDALALLALFTLMHGAVYGLWLWTPGEEIYRLYYFMPEVMLVAAALGSAWGSRIFPGAPPPGSTSRTLPAWVRPAAAAGLLVLGYQTLRATAASPRWASADPGPVAGRHIYGWVERTLSPDAVLGARDAGKLGYFCRRPVVNLDGLINDQRLLAAIREDREAEYVFASPIRYLLYDRPVLGGFDASRPERPPDKPAGVGLMLYRLANAPGCSLREIPGPPPDWVVLEIIRTTRSGANLGGDATTTSGCAALDDAGGREGTG